MTAEIPSRLQRAADLISQSDVLIVTAGARQGAYPL
jgi:NAD(P)H-dependent FMN reductase